MTYAVVPFNGKFMDDINNARWEYTPAMHTQLARINCSSCTIKEVERSIETDGGDQWNLEGSVHVSLTLERGGGSRALKSGQNFTSVPHAYPRAEPRGHQMQMRMQAACACVRMLSASRFRSCTGSVSYIRAVKRIIYDPAPRTRVRLLQWRVHGG